MYKRILALLLLCSLKVQANDLYQINDALIRHKENLDVHLLMDDNGFKVEKDGELHEVQSYFVDPIIRNVKNQNKLDKFFEKGCSIAIKEMDNGEFRLQSSVPGLGGGPICGAIAYFTIKIGFWGSVALGVTSVTIATAGTAPAVIGAVAAASPAIGAIAGGITGAAAGMAAAGAAATATGAAMAGTAAMGTTAVVTSLGGIAATAAVVESTATAVGLCIGSWPFLP